jgi:hypothetical protein
MDALELALIIVLLAVAIVLLAVRFRSTPGVGGSISLTDKSTGKRLTTTLINKTVTKALTAATTGKPVVAITMRTTRTSSGEPTSTEVITIDGQTYNSIDEIPPDVRDHVRKVLAAARLRAGQPLGAEGAMVQIENDLAKLGLDLREPADPAEGRPPAG